MDLDDILDYIEQNLKRELTLAELSERYHYSPRQLYYYLHGITGMPIMTYIRKHKPVNAVREISFLQKLRNGIVRQDTRRILGTLGGTGMYTTS